MRVLVTGASGFLGQAVLRELVGGGHTAVGLVRSPAQVPEVTAAGATAVLGDVTQPSTLGPAVRGTDAVVHLAQARSGAEDEARAVRVEGARNLAKAARSAGTQRLILGSGYWVYRSNPGTITEESPLEPIGLSKVNFDAEEVAREAARDGGIQTIVVRPGMVYGDGSWFGEMLRELQDGTYRYIGDGANRLSPVARSDAGTAFRTLVEEGRSGETYLVVDDAPVSTREFAEFVARTIRARPPGSIGLADAAKAWGSDLARLNAADRAASNRKLRELGWAPRYASYRDGLTGLLRGLARPSP